MNLHNTVWTDLAAGVTPTLAADADSATTVVLTVISLLVTVAIAVTGWITVHNDRSANINTTDLNLLISLLHEADIEARRVASMPQAACRGDFRDLERMIPHLESHGAHTVDVLEALVWDVVESMKDYIDSPIDASIPTGDLTMYIRRQTRAADKLLAALDRALTSARLIRS
ncbi:hypothetical protein [Streptomyces sp. 35G-GA-8]|uniref:hypothetical protein n=1 Tax=Streptomyces sp. 35G-GA-8 TaxID=2939434 RepID=UPI00201ED26F|nr:hypothetical protein [Streptomyces sp. 35G-GA-8]MCL7382494.1 hypothetical protein [Streptomyces sp. 35G-GA-8]